METFEGDVCKKNKGENGKKKSEGSALKTLGH